MSERKAKNIRKIENEAKVAKAPKSKDSLVSNIIIAVVILAVLVLGAFAVVPKYIERAKENAKATQTTIEYADEIGISYEEFLAQYGLSDTAEITEESLMTDAAQYMTLDNYAKYVGGTVENLKIVYGLGEDVPNETLWKDAVDFMPTEVVANNFFGMDFNSFVQGFGVPDTIKPDTVWSETNRVMNELYEAQMSQQEATDEGSETAGE